MSLCCSLVAKIIAEHKPQLKTKTDIWDVFNDKPDWNAQSWADLKRLNALILSVVEKFELLDKSNKKVASELEKYLHNLEEIQQSLGTVEALTLSQKSKKQDLEPQLKQINGSIQEFMKKGVYLQHSSFAGSTLLKPEHVAQLHGWYGGGWKLAYKASRDGWESTRFHALCDNKGESVTVVSHSSGAFLIGGYTSLPWNSTGSYFEDPQASLFTLVNPDSVTAQFPSKSHAIYCNPLYGPTFGGGHDLYVSNNSKTSAASFCNFPSEYTDTSGYGRSVMDDGTHWNADDVEVYIKS